jgi:PIN domain nuclease of toxin-antitoxin system
VTTVLLDTHTVVWASLEPQRLSAAARTALEEADEQAVAAITWYELAWLVQWDRVHVNLPLDTWLDRLAAEVRTVPITPAIAQTAVRLPRTFPRDPIDRMIYATAVENGWRLVTKDSSLRRHRHPYPVTIW